MPHPKANRGEKVACYCGMPNRPNPHFVSVRTRYRHLNQTTPVLDTRNNGDNTSNHENSNNEEPQDELMQVEGE